MSTPIVQVNCPHCKILLKVNNISVSQGSPGSEPTMEETDVLCPSCKKPVFRVSTRKVL